MSHRSVTIGGVARPADRCRVDRGGRGRGRLGSGGSRRVTAWLDQFLKERDTGILDAPAVQVQTDLGAWRHERDWPPSKAKQLVLHPDASGALGDRPGGGSASCYDYQGRLAEPGEAELTGQSDRVVFVSEPLTKDLHLAGLPRFEGTVTASGNRASLMLTLLESTPLGDRSLNYAALSPNHARDLATGEESVSGITQRVAVDFFPQDDVVRAGNRLVLVAAGNLLYEAAAGPDLQPTSDGSTITLELDGARLTLPVDHTVAYEEE